MGASTSSGGEAEQTVDLLERARTGDQEAWERLYERYEGELRRRVRARFGSELRAVEESVDVFQSVWREAISSLKHFHYRGEGSFLAWLATVLRNKLSSRAERMRTVKRGGPAPSGSVYAKALSRSADAKPGPATRAEHDEDEELLLQTVEQLPADQRDLVRWALFEGRTHREIGRRLGIGEDAARMRVARAEARLSTLFRRLHGGDDDSASASSPR